jgi:hypothetical protein
MMTLMKMPLPLLLLGLLVAGCATAPAGEDARGKDLQAQATTILEALNAYHKDHGSYPGSLQELAPKYLRNVPFDPGVVLDHNNGTAHFAYPAPFPQGGDVICIAKLGTTEWKCAHDG